MRADGLALERADEYGQDRLAGDGEREVVAPEMGEALDQGRLRIDGGERARADLLQIERAGLPAELLLQDRLVLDGVDEITRMVAARAEAGELRRQGRPGQLVRQPAARITADAVEVAIGRAEAEAVDGDEGLGPGGHGRHRRSRMAARPSADSCGIAALITPWMASCNSRLRACIAS